MKNVVGICILILLVACSRDFSSKETSKETAEQIAAREWLKSTIIPEVVFQETPLIEALSFFMERSVELGHANMPPSIFQAPSRTSVKPDEPVSNGGGFDDAPAGGGFGGGSKPSLGNTSITFRATNISVWDALQRTVDQVDLSLEIESSGSVIIVPKKK